MRFHLRSNPDLTGTILRREGNSVVIIYDDDPDHTPVRYRIPAHRIVEITEEITDEPNAD